MLSYAMEKIDCLTVFIPFESTFCSISDCRPRTAGIVVLLLGCRSWYGCILHSHKARISSPRLPLAFIIVHARCPLMVGLTEGKQVSTKGKQGQKDILMFSVVQKSVPNLFQSFIWQLSKKGVCDDVWGIFGRNKAPKNVNEVGQSITGSLLTHVHFAMLRPCVFWQHRKCAQWWRDAW